MNYLPPPSDGRLRNMSNAVDQALIKLQYWLPAHFISRLVGAVCRCRIAAIKNVLIRSFVWLYNIDTAEAGQPVPAGYPDFNAFFTRELKPGSRPVDESPTGVASPADGTVTQIGRIAGQQLIQAKHLTYTLPQLFGGEEFWSQQLSSGAYATIYLAPNNYHRVHAPLDAELREMVYVPGRLLSVNARTADVIPGLFAGNERLVCHFDGPLGPFSIVMIGAMNVGSISTTWAGQVTPHTPRETSCRSYPGSESPVRLNKGEYLGQFCMGSTVIMIAGPDQLAWHKEVKPGSTVRMGQQIGKLTNDPAT
jgi:phosphatidylserine decarboxylase